jgi:molybdate transport system substrate-binding protein
VAWALETMKLCKDIFHLGLLAGLLCGLAQRSIAQVTVFAAASLMESLKEIGADYEKQSREKVIFNFAGSSTLARQIEEGAPADIFFSADEAQMDRLESKSLVVEGTRRNRLSNMLVIVVAADRGANVHGPRDLLSPEIRRLTLGDPNSVPIGVYAKEYLASQGLWMALAPKVVPTENVRGALAAVESGNAEASIVYRTDALISKKVVIAYSVPLEKGPKIRYPVALLRGAKAPVTAKIFFEFLNGPSAGKIFQERGFVVLP